MKLRSSVARSLVCCSIFASSILAAGQTHRVVVPHAAGVTPPPVHVKHSLTQAEVTPAGATWTKAKNAPAVSVGAMLLLTDGRVLVHSEPNCIGCTGDYNDWYTLTPDNTGSYVNGTWKQVASFPSGYNPLFFASAVLKDGKVAVQGGEYNCPNSNCSAIWQSLGAIYDPVANKWTATTPPANSNIGDAESVVLPDGTWMVAQCCAIVFGNSTAPVYYTFNESARTFTTKSNATDGKFDDFDEEGWTLLPNKKVLTVDAYTSNTILTGTNSELYDSSTNTWTTAGSTIKQLWDSDCGSGFGSFEVGPAVLRPDGTVFATGSSDCSAGHTAIYNSTNNSWKLGPDFPSSNAANDSPAALEINGNVVVEASPFSGTFSPPSKFYEWNGTTLTAIANPPNAANTPSFQGHLLVLPNGQIMYTDYSKDVEFLTSTGTFTSSWQPTVTSVNSTLSTGSTVTISGTQFNGLSEANAYGDDFQDATNYPLVRIVNNATGHVIYARTHDHSTMGVATGPTVVSTSFDVPTNTETGLSELFVVANGIPSAGTAVTITGGTGLTPTTTALASNANPSNVNQNVTFTATVTPVNSPAPTGTVSFTSNGTAITGCSAVTLAAAGTAKCTTKFAASGTFSIVATYSGDSKYAGSTSTALSQVVNGGTGTTTTKLVSSKNPSVVKVSVKFTATVTPSTATGTVKFTANGNTLPSCGAVKLTAGAASCSIAFPKTGTFSMVATYSGDTKNQGSTSPTLSQVVNAH